MIVKALLQEQGELLLDENGEPVTDAGGEGAAGADGAAAGAAAVEPLPPPKRVRPRRKPPQNVWKPFQITPY